MRRPPPPGATAPVFYEQEEHAHGDGGTLFGFWLYLMSDCLIFAVLFATFGVLGRNYAAGPSGADLFDLRLVAVNTALLLLSSITYGFAMLEMDKDRRQGRHSAWLGGHGSVRGGLRRHRALRIHPSHPRGRRPLSAAPSCPPSSRWWGRTGCTSPSASSGSSR